MSLPVVLLTVLAVSAPRSTIAHPSTVPPINAQPARQSLRTLGTLGILFGAIETETAFERRLERLGRDLDRPLPGAERARLQQALTGTHERARVALHILGTALDLAGTKRAADATAGELRRALVVRTQEMLSKRSATARTGPATNGTQQLLVEMRRQLAPQLRRAARTLGDLSAPVAANLAATLGTDLIHRLLLQVLPRRVRLEDLLAAGLKAHVATILGARHRRQPEPETNEIAVSVDPESGESQEEEDDEEGPGGLVGLIASLSGGDEGSDVGALIGSLSAVVTNLFGPGGLDVPGLLGTGTSLIAGLLGGDDNFGKVLGSYVGVAIEGLSGGGADMNGAFFGNFLGALIAALSSDPEDDSLPLKPKLFVENFFTGLEAAKRKGDAEACCPQPGSDLFGFLGHVVSSVVGGVTSLVLNASLGSSGGSSQGSADASGASSAGSSGGSGSGDHPGA
uniref:Uncharacterized protein n=1 Tax=Anopheles dirus TaxID=7168 RepID=A0A182MZY3_9DIPT